MTVGIRGHPPIIDGETFADLKKEESMWTLDDGKLIHIVIEKVRLLSPYYSIIRRNAHLGKQNGMVESSSQIRSRNQHT